MSATAITGAEPAERTARKAGLVLILMYIVAWVIAVGMLTCLAAAEA